MEPLRVHAVTHLVTHSKAVSHTLMSLAGISSALQKIGCSYSWSFTRESRIRCESLSLASFSGGGGRSENADRSGKDLQKEMWYTHLVIYSESKRKRHMKQWTELCELGVTPDKTEFLADVQSYAGSIKCPVPPTTPSIYNLQVGPESTVQLPAPPLPSLGFTMTSTECF